MTPRDSKQGKGKDKDKDKTRPPKLEPRRRGQGDIEPTTPKTYTLPFQTILEIRRMAREYGSQGRALQVGVEILARLRKRPEVDPVDREQLMRMSYKLTPRTISQIDRLARTEYESAGEAISACVKTLKMKKIG